MLHHGTRRAAACLLGVISWAAGSGCTRHHAGAPESITRGSAELSAPVIRDAVLAALGQGTTDAPNARSFAIGPEGIVFVSAREGGAVYALVDADADHRVDRIQRVASGLEAPDSIAYLDGALYIAERSRTLRIEDIDMRLEAPPERVVEDRLLEHEFHGWLYIRFGLDGWLYIPRGPSCPAWRGDDATCFTVSRVGADGVGSGSAELEGKLERVTYRALCGRAPLISG